MGIIFLNHEDDLNRLSSEIFGLLGLNDPSVTESLNVYQGFYHSFSLLGMKIKLEYNSYDYEDEYKYMISVSKEMTSHLKTSESSVEYLTSIVVDILSSNMGVLIAKERNGELQIINPT